MDPTAVDLATRVISSLGFPIFVAIWLLWRTDGLLRELRDGVRDLKETIIECMPKTGGSP